MYKLNLLPSAHPYKSTGRVYLAADAKKFYEVSYKAIKDNPPSWVKKWKEGDWIEVTAKYYFKTKAKFPDPNNLHICLINGIQKGLNIYNSKIDDRWILLKDEVPEFGKVGVEFTLDIIQGHTRRNHEEGKREKRSYKKLL